MATLGTSYRVFYQSKNQASGLTGIFAQAKKPDGSTIGNFPLVELSGPMFLGCYYFDLITSASDPEGKWLIGIYSPSENYRAFEGIDYASASTAGNPWSYPILVNQTTGSFGEFVVQKVLTVSKYLGLK